MIHLYVACGIEFFLKIARHEKSEINVTENNTKYGNK